MPTDARLSQLLAEFAVSPDPDARLSQLLAEFAVDPSSDARLSAAILEFAVLSVPPLLTVSVNEAITVADARTASFGTDRKIETITVAESVTRAFNQFLPTLAESSAVTDAVAAKILGLLKRPVADSLSVAEATQRQLVYLAANSALAYDIVAVSDVVTSQDRSAQRQDAVSVSDSVVAALSAGRLSAFVRDTITITESRTRSARLLKLVALPVEQIHVTEHRLPTLPPTVWDGTGSPPTPGTIAADYWVVGI